MNIEEHKLFGTYSFLLNRAFRKMRKYSKARMREAGIELTIEQFVILRSLVEEEGLSQKELADRVLKDTPTVTRMLDLMVQKGYVTRDADPGDRRKFLIMLTQAGRDAHANALPVIIELRKKGWEGLDADDLEVFNRILRQIEQNFA